MTAPRPSLSNNPDPLVRETYAAHIWLFVLGAPFNAMIQYASTLAVKTFNVPEWAPALSAIIPAAHLLAIFFAATIARSNKTGWVVWPTIVSCAVFALLPLAGATRGWIFAAIIIFSLLLRAPIISAQSSIFRTNYPPTLRSFALSVPLALQTGVLALYALDCGHLFDQSEKWVVPAFLLAGLCGIIGAWRFRRVRAAEEPGARGAPHRGAETQTRSPAVRWSAFLGNRPFLIYQLSYMFFGSGSVAVTAVMPFYLTTEFDASHYMCMLAINTIPNLTMALTLPFWGRLLDRFNPLTMRAVTTGIWMFTPLLLFAARTINGVYAAQFIQGLVVSGSTLIWWLGVNYFGRAAEVPRLMSVHQTLTGVRGIIMPFLGIWIAHRIGYRQSMIFWFVMMAIGFGIMVWEVWSEGRRGGLRTFSEAEAVLDRPPAGDDWQSEPL